MDKYRYFLNKIDKFQKNWKDPSQLDKAVQSRGVWYPLESDKEGMPHPDKPGRIKHTAQNGKAVWSLGEDEARKAEGYFVKNYSDYIRKNQDLHPGHKKMMAQLGSMLAKDPDRHVLGSGTTPNAPYDHKELRLRHFDHALRGTPGYQINFHPGKIEITAERHSKNPQKKGEATSWNFDGAKITSKTFKPQKITKGQPDEEERFNDRRDVRGNGRGDGSSGSGLRGDARGDGGRRGRSLRFFQKVRQLKKAEESPAQNAAGHAEYWQKTGNPADREALLGAMKHPEVQEHRQKMVDALIGSGLSSKEIERKPSPYSLDQSPKKTKYIKLYRGIGSEEEDYNDNDIEGISYTSDKSVAKNFADSYGGKMISRWVPADSIYFSMPHGHLIGANTHAGEAEVISDHPGYSDKEMRSIEGSSLKKGAMKRLAPYSPKDIDPADKKYLNKWTTHGNIDRDQLPHMNDMGENYKKRAFHKMSSLTPYRRNPETGEREFLLHRGKTMFDIANEVTGDYEPSLSSYTTDPSIAINFNEDAIRDGLAQGIDEYDADDFGFGQARSHFANSFHKKYPEAGKTPEEALENAYNKGFTKEGIGKQHVLDHAKQMHGHIYSAWVPESAIHNMPMMIGGSRPDGTPGPHNMARESEVIVDRSKFQPKKLNRQEAGKLALAHHDFINARTKRILNRRS